MKRDEVVSIIQKYQNRKFIFLSQLLIFLIIHLKFRIINIRNSQKRHFFNRHRHLHRQIASLSSDAWRNKVKDLEEITNSAVLHILFLYILNAVS